MPWLMVLAVLVTATSAEEQRTSRGAGVEGRVVSARTGNPVAGAQVVRAVRPAAPPLASTLSDGRGRFVLQGVPPGASGLWAVKSGYRGGGYGQRSATGSSQLLDLEEGDRVEGVVLRLWEDASIEGRVVDEAGEPVTGVPVLALARRLTGEGARLARAPVRPATTDDRGFYRIVGLVPGHYMVGVPAEETPLGYGPPSAAEPEFVTMFFPQARRASAGLLLTLDAGDELTNIDFRVEQGGTRTVSGRFVGLSETRYSDLILEAVSDGLPTDLDVRGARVAPDGRFAFPGVPFGHYRLRLVAFPGWGNTRNIGGLNVIISAPGLPVAPVPAGVTWWTDLPIAVDEDGPGELVVQPLPGARIRGRVVFEGTAGRPADAALVATPIMADRSDGRVLQGPPAARIEPDGTFETAGLPPGRYNLRLLFPLESWQVQSLHVAGREAADFRVDLASADVDEVVITLTDRPIELRGAIRDAAGRARPDASVLVFPADRGLWRDVTSRPARFHEVRPDRWGRYGFSGVPAGEYYVVAVVAELPQWWQEAAHLDPLVPLAERVRLDRGLRTVRDLVVRSGR